MRRRRLLIVAGLAILLLAALPTVAFAAAGSGSSAFSSGGGGGGGGGKGFAIYLIFRLLIDLIIFGHGTGLVIAIVLVAIGCAYYFGWWQQVQDFFTAQRRRGPARRRQAKLRQRRVELAAAEAADADAAFSPERVRAAGEQLFLDIQTAWSRGDVATLQRLVAPRLMGEWERRLDDLNRRGMTNHVEVTRPPKVEYVGIGRGAKTASAQGGGPDRVVVRIEARIRDWVTDSRGRELNERGAPTKTVRLREYWTLERTVAANRPDDNGLSAEFDLSAGSAGGPTGDWVLASIEQGAEGSHQLEARIVQTEWADTDALRDDALLEQAQADAQALDGISPAELTDATVAFDVDARARALDLSLQDGRFAPDVIEIAARRAVTAWAQAIDGETRPLLTLATPEAADLLLHPAGPGSRMVVRGPEVERISIVALDPLSVPATLTVDVKISGRRYLQDRRTAAIVAGSDIHRVTFTDRWTLTLAGDAEHPWQLTGVASPTLSR